MSDEDNDIRYLRIGDLTGFDDAEVMEYDTNLEVEKCSKEDSQTDCT